MVAPLQAKRPNQPFPAFSDQGPARPAYDASRGFFTTTQTASYQPAPVAPRPPSFDHRLDSRSEPIHRSATGLQTRLSNSGWHLAHTRAVATSHGAAFQPPQAVQRRPGPGSTQYKLPGYMGYQPVVDTENLFGLSYARHATEASRVRAHRRLEPFKAASAPRLPTATNDPLERATRAMHRRHPFMTEPTNGSPFRLLHPL